MDQFDKRPKYGGRKKGSVNKHKSIFATQLITDPYRSVASVLQDTNFCPATQMVRCYNFAIGVYENYGVIYDAISQARENKGLFPVDDKAHIYLKIASDIAKELAQYCYPKMRSKETLKEQATALTEDQKIDLMNRYLDVLKARKNDGRADKPDTTGG